TPLSFNYIDVLQSYVGAANKSSALDDEQKNKESCINFLAEVGVIASGGKTYEEEFALEMVKARQGKAKSTPWGSSFAPPPEVLHGYNKKVTGKTAEERLDMRSAIKILQVNATKSDGGACALHDAKDVHTMFAYRQPSSSKSTTVAKLKQALQEAGHNVVIIGEESLGLLRNQAYKDGHVEKTTRSLIKSEVDRRLAPNVTVVVDSINGIKGYRYEIWCIARSARTKFATLHVDATPSQCREWNMGRPEAERYTAAILDDLLGRFERPDSRNRWDMPLITARPAEGEANVREAIDLVLVAVDPNTETIPRAGIASKALEPTVATTNAPLSSTNLLHEIDRMSQDIIQCIMTAQTESSSGVAECVQCPNGITLRMHRPMPLQELRRHKRDFMKLVTNVVMTQVPTAASATTMFVDYLKQRL
ncbi:chromatin associated protein KTI12, partial [Helicosporidium sp. ATCC 50920]